MSAPEVFGADLQLGFRFLQELNDIAVVRRIEIDCRGEGGSRGSGGPGRFLFGGLFKILGVIFSGMLCGSGCVLSSI